ncbi:MAG: ATP-binding protein, partial [Candidatus Omnitrophica bacterium]|nr:ATP-binding protein [Candidatus Omnitrophota bacterium]
MKAKQYILDHLRKHGVIRTRDIVRALRISRQTAHQHLQELILAGKLVKEGSTLSARYRLFSKGQHEKTASFSGIRKVRGLEEDRIYGEAELRLRLKQVLSPEAFKIARYAFTEMMNNAISHSRAKEVEFQLKLGQGEFRFRILDRGIGVFESVRKKFKLEDSFEAAEHLLKGKQTTDPEHHSGQGIFFTSKIADRFSLSSKKLSLITEAGQQEVFLEELRKPFQIGRA